jgi:hypothetical protein
MTATSYRNGWHLSVPADLQEQTATFPQICRKVAKAKLDNTMLQCNSKDSGESLSPLHDHTFDKSLNVPHHLLQCLKWHKEYRPTARAEHKERSMAAKDFRVEVVGIDQVRKNLLAMDKEIGTELTKEIRSAANELRDGARSLIPTAPPLSNWAGTGRAQPSRLPYWEGTAAAKSGMKSIIGQGSRQRGTYRRGAVARVHSTNAAAVVFDKVGDAAPTSTFVANMVNKHGPKRRALLKAADDKRDKLRGKIEKAVERAVAKYNNRI